MNVFSTCPFVTCWREPTNFLTIVVVCHAPELILVRIKPVYNAFLNGSPLLISFKIKKRASQCAVHVLRIKNNPPEKIVEGVDGNRTGFDIPYDFTIELFAKIRI